MLPAGPDTPAMQDFHRKTQALPYRAIPSPSAPIPAPKAAAPSEKSVGRVTRVITREKLSVVGNVARSGRNYFLIPDDPKFIQHVLLKPSAVEADAGDKAVVELDDWADRRQPLTGVIARAPRPHA